jgi:hypothetical protein
MNHYRMRVFPDLVHRFRSRFGITIQLGYASLTRPAHTPYNHLIVKEFLTSLNQDLQRGSCDTTSFVPLGTLSCWSGGVRISCMLRASGHWLHVRANRASRSGYRDALAPRTP